MRGIISFILLIFLIESFLIILSLNSLEYENSSDKLYHSVKLLDFYEQKIITKREIQNILSSGSHISNPQERIEFVSNELEKYELLKEISSEYKIDLWCGYMNADDIEFMLHNDEKPLNIQDFNSKIVIGKNEVHYCSTVLVYDNELNSIKVGRNYDNQHFNLIPVIGFKIKSHDASFIDVDYI
jgi:hypothetical protein